MRGIRKVMVVINSVRDKTYCVEMQAAAYLYGGGLGELIRSDVYFGVADEYSEPMRLSLIDLYTVLRNAGFDHLEICEACRAFFPSTQVAEYLCSKLNVK